MYHLLDSLKWTSTEYTGSLDTHYICRHLQNYGLLSVEDWSSRDMLRSLQTEGKTAVLLVYFPLKRGKKTEDVKFFFLKV